jgi:hypothetical protein
MAIVPWQVEYGSLCVFYFDECARICVMYVCLYTARLCAPHLAISFLALSPVRALVFSAVVVL